MNIKITVPSKTFFIGDYISLLGGPVLILNTEPRFQCLARQGSFTHTFHMDSPAGKFIHCYADDFRGCEITFFDPHQASGGFGASSAQFVMVYVLRQYLLNVIEQRTVNNFESLLKVYQDMAWNGASLRPSGADCVGQMSGNICYYHREAQQLETLCWPFPDMDFCLLHTGHKISTHIHLQEISMEMIPVKELQQLVFTAYSALKTAHLFDFIDALRAYAELQQNIGLLAMTTQNLLTTIIKKKGVLFAKGCGALGADVILVLLERAHSLSFASSMQRQGLRVIALGNETSTGLEIRAI